MNHVLRLEKEIGRLKNVTGRYRIDEGHAMPLAIAYPLIDRKTYGAFVHTYTGIYSFPKSGNTWISGICSYLFFHGNLDAVPSIYTSEPSLAPRFFMGSDTFSFYRSHSQHPWSPLTKKDVDMDDSASNRHKVFYIYRNPLDVFLSSLNWIGNVEGMAKYFIDSQVRTVDELVASGDLKHYFSAFMCHMTLQPEFQDAGRWDYNVIEWLQAKEAGYDVTLIRYEDIFSNAASALLPIFSCMGVDEDSLLTAIHEFDLRHPRDGKFFWSKKSGMHKDLIPSNMRHEFQSRYSDCLSRLGFRLD
jgi:hypothetical protein